MKKFPIPPADLAYARACFVKHTQAAARALAATEEAQELYLIALRVAAAVCEAAGFTEDLSWGVNFSGGYVYVPEPGDPEPGTAEEVKKDEKFH